MSEQEEGKATTSEGSKIPAFAVEALRAPRKGVIEQLLLRKLWSSNIVDSLERVRRLCQAGWFALQVYKDLEIDLDTVNGFYKVASSLASAESNKHHYGYRSFVVYYSIPWSFRRTRENFNNYIKPWLRGYDHFTSLVPPLGSFKTYKTRVLCGHCSTILLDTSRRSEEEIIRLICRKFKEKIQIEKKVLINKEACKSNREIANSIDSVTYSYKKYVPPFSVKKFFECPKCKKQIVLERKVDSGSHKLWYGNPRVGPITSARLKMEDYDVISEDFEAIVFFTTSPYLTRQGRKELVNSFVSYADPIVTQWEAKIGARISPRAWTEFLSTMEDREEKEEAPNP